MKQKSRCCEIIRQISSAPAEQSQAQLIEATHKIENLLSHKREASIIISQELSKAACKTICWKKARQHIEQLDETKTAPFRSLWIACFDWGGGSTDSMQNLKKRRGKQNKSLSWCARFLSNCCLSWDARTIAARIQQLGSRHCDPA